LSVPSFSRLHAAVKPKIARLYQAFVLASALVGFGPCSRGEPVGVKDCDTYVERFESCVEKLSDDEQAARAPEAEAMRKVLREEARRPESKDKVGAYCKAALPLLQDCP
jgi:hypothetical protein